MTEPADRPPANAAPAPASDPGTKGGSVALCGRPNAGKSSLLNRLLGEKLAIVSDRPQTTRQRIVGILTEPRGQIAFHDTPGLHRPLHKLNQQMVQAAREALGDCDVVCLLVDLTEPFGRGDAFALDLVARSPAAKVLALNKCDLVEKPKILPRMAHYSRVATFADIVPISARTGDGCDRLLDVLFKLLPVAAPVYDADLLTIHPDRFLVAETIREKVLWHTKAELPFATAVTIDRWEETDQLIRIFASILVERSGQRLIVVGKQGAMIKAIGTAARQDIEAQLGRHVYLDLHVREEPGWREQPNLLAEMAREVYTIPLPHGESGEQIPPPPFDREPEGD